MAAPDPLLKTQQVAAALGVSVSTLKRWVDKGALRAARTVGKHRLIGLSEALRFARSQGLPESGLQALADPGGMAAGLIDAGVRDALTEAIRRGDARRGRAILVSAYAAGGGAAALADQLIRPVMERIGHGWKVGDLDVFQEHQAAHIVASALHDLNERASRTQRVPAPLALGATPEGDPYILPLLLGELVLREQGWDVRNLGVNLPLRSLAVAAIEYHPALIFLSVNDLPDEARFTHEYLSFYATAAAAGAAVVLGGRALGAGLRAGLTYAGFGDRMAHLSEFARRLAPAPRAALNGTFVPDHQHGSADPRNG
ncbi:MAG: B12-binding domain-containing protein [Planctomycetia bacterium]|nr:B12-binding domain-containing protein [Planctomycetia bacterium]